MIIPVRCFTCGKVIGNKWETYLSMLQADLNEGDALDELGLKRYCCRRMVLTHVDLIEKLLNYNCESCNPMLLKRCIDSQGAVAWSIRYSGSWMDPSICTRIHVTSEASLLFNTGSLLPYSPEVRKPDMCSFVLWVYISSRNLGFVRACVQHISRFPHNPQAGPPHNPHAHLLQPAVTVLIMPTICWKRGKGYKRASSQKLGKLRILMFYPRIDKSLKQTSESLKKCRSVITNF